MSEFRTEDTLIWRRTL